VVQMKVEITREELIPKTTVDHMYDGERLWFSLQA
jgi:hypothetical protein